MRPAAPQPRAWNSQRGVRAAAVEAASPPRSRATTMADTIAANSNPDPGYVKDDLPGTWTLRQIEGEPNKFQTKGQHLKRLGLSAGEPLVFTVSKKLG